MRRRHAVSFVLAAIMLVPALAVALPGREELGMRQVEPQTLITSFNLSPTNPFGEVTPILAEGRQYKFVVQGTWKPTASPGNFADAGWETSNSWGNVSKTGRGVAIGVTNYASPANNSLTYDPVNHRYEISYFGRGIEEIVRLVDTNYDDNSTAPGSPNGLSVEVYQLSKVKWVLDLSGPFPPSPVPNPYVKETISPSPISPGTIPEVGVPGVGVPGVGVPVLGNVRIRDRGALFCLTVQVSGGSETDLACTLDPGVGQQDPVLDVPIGGSQVPGATICAGGCTLVPGGPVSPIPVPSFTVEGGLPPGSKLQLVLSWEADRSKLWRTMVNDGTSENQYVAPYDPRKDSAWYATEASGGRLALRITATVLDSSGNPIGGAPVLSTGIPGVGQLIESMFESKALGR